MKSFILALCLLPLQLMAHKDHDHSLSATAQMAAKGAIKAVETAVVGAAASVTIAAKVTPKLDWMAIMKSSAGTHHHNKVVHFPIALGLAGVLFGLLAYKFESFRFGSRWLLFFAALASLLAIYTGRGQEDSVEGVMAKQVFEAHEGQGYIVCGMLWLNWLMSFFPSARKWSWLLLLLLAWMITGAAMLGGALAHMQF